MPLPRRNADSQPKVIEIPELRQESTTFHILGTTPLIYNSMSFKAMTDLLLPAGRKTAADRAGTLKHNPEEEFRASLNTFKAENEPTLLAFMASAFKSGMMTAALDVPGATKASIGRLVWVDGFYVPVWGIPKLYMAVTRMADAAKTPDVRTRGIVTKWATAITVNWAVPQITQTAVVNLLSFAGVTAGAGDWRPEKGKGTFGQFRLCNPDDPEYVRVQKAGERKAQQTAVESAECYDEETQELLDWYNKEVVKRGRK